MFTPQDSHYLARCLDLARMASRLVSPNPYVGSVVVYQGRIIGEGFHQQAGGPHAEVHAIASVQDKSLLSRSTIYVSLEPCAHTGKTPPCADLIVRHAIPRVVIGMQDPNPKVDGGGIARLRAAGIEVVLAPDPQPFEAINQVFLHHIAKKRPYITLKWAQTQDGFLAGINEGGNPTPLQITSLQANARVHRLRAEHQGILVGRATAEIDHPRLTTRRFAGPDPVKIVLDPHLKLSLDLNLFSRGQTWLINEHKQAPQPFGEYIKWSAPDDLEGLLTFLYKEKDLNAILVEGGRKVLDSFLDQGLYDCIYRFTSPQYIGNGLEAPKQWLPPPVETSTLGPDRLDIFKPIPL